MQSAGMLSDLQTCFRHFISHMHCQEPCKRWQRRTKASVVGADRVGAVRAGCDNGDWPSAAVACLGDTAVGGN